MVLLTDQEIHRFTRTAILRQGCETRKRYGGRMDACSSPQATIASRNIHCGMRDGWDYLAGPIVPADRVVLPVQHHVARLPGLWDDA